MPLATSICNINYELVNDYSNNLMPLATSIMRYLASRFVSKRQRQGFLVSVAWVRASVCKPVTLQCFTCLLDLQGIQWIRELVVVRVS
jgi:hypothetical protein